MFGEKLQRALPRSLIRFGPIAVPAVAFKAVRRVVVEINFMRLAETSQFGIELAHLVGRRIFIELAEVALDRAGDIGRPSRRCRPIAPLLIATAAVEIDRDFEGFTRRRGKKRDSSTHAETDDAKTRTVDIGAAF